ncbi:hypothetical protein [Pseudomonas kulmbachensis]|uniref:capsular polysaccharide export protein, LipB/KpsS family n=1 Tax=Pseudomonas kulmbachensis TaxID=3043408 RepID=UPI002AB15696|nr:hypothetical protein [Pseudomonas sp. V3/3/4/13]
MNILILSNGAPGYHNFFNSLANKFSSDEANVFFAVDCKTSEDENELHQFGNKVYEFSSFFADHATDFALLERYAAYNMNSALLSDFERAEVYSLWGPKKPDFYENLKSALLSFFEKIIKERNIDVVIYENVSNAFAHFAWFACQENNIIYRGVTSSRLPGRFAISDNPLSEDIKIQDTFEKINNGEIIVPQEIRNWCSEYIENIENIVPDYMKFNNLENTSLINKYYNKGKIKKLLIYKRHLNDDHYHSFQRGNPLNRTWQMFKRSLLRKLRSSSVMQYYSLPNTDDAFLLYPLHYHPESSTSILAGTYLNELEVIRNIAFNLPQGLTLYVKDHMSAFAYPEIKFYKTIASLPNVKILHPNSPTKELIKASKAVITLTSTVGYEALLLGKKVFLFGSVFYQQHANVTSIKNPSKLFETLKNELAKPNTITETYNKNFVAAYYMNTIKGGLNIMLDKDKAQSLVEQLYPDIKNELTSSLEKNSQIKITAMKTY